MTVLSCSGSSHLPMRILIRMFFSFLGELAETTLLGQIKDSENYITTKTWLKSDCSLKYLGVVVGDQLSSFFNKRGIFYEFHCVCCLFIAYVFHCVVYCFFLKSNLMCFIVLFFIPYFKKAYAKSMREIHQTLLNFLCICRSQQSIHDRHPIPDV